jgi:hypothetical protein
MHPVVITARDGLRLLVYLSLPVLPGVPSVLPTSVAGEVPTVKNSAFASSNASSAAVRSSDRSIHWAPKPASAAAAALAAAGGVKPLNLNLPMVLYVHGGPWSRDYWGFDPVVQWMNNRGYAVLQVNYRGSAGVYKCAFGLGFSGSRDLLGFRKRKTLSRGPAGLHVCTICVLLQLRCSSHVILEMHLHIACCAFAAACFLVLMLKGWIMMHWLNSRGCTLLQLTSTECHPASILCWNLVWWSILQCATSAQATHFSRPPCCCCCCRRL